jgi:hypothetical protein
VPGHRNLAGAFAALALSLCAVSAFAASPKLTDDQLAEVMDFTMHDATFTLFHESGHLLIHELDLPVLGKEEDAADAAGVLEMFKSITDKDEAYNALNDVADYWTYSSNSMTDEDFSFNVNTYDDHSLDVQRANNMVCLMVGQDQDEFADTAQAFEFDDDMIDQCLADYEQADHSWTKVLAPYIAKSPGPVIKVTYEAAGKYQKFADELKKRGILENIGTTLSTNFALPRPITMTAKTCDEPNAFYDEETHSITYCYELADDVYQLGLKNLFAKDTGGASN